MSKYDCLADGMFWSNLLIDVARDPRCSASTTGDSPVTVIDCSTLPHLELDVDLKGAADLDAHAVASDGAEALERERQRVIAERRFSNRYRPCASVTSTAAPPIRAGLEASTVTPARTPPCHP